MDGFSEQIRLEEQWDMQYGGQTKLLKMLDKIMRNLVIWGFHIFGAVAGLMLPGSILLLGGFLFSHELKLAI